VIRHGQTPWTISGRHTGSTDLALTEFGEAQARQFKDALSGIELSAVLVSPLQRARRTCELAGLLATARVEPSLAEWHYGDYEGLTRAQIQLHQPGWEVFRDGCPGGESAAELTARVDALITLVRAIPGRTVLFSHGHLLRSLAARWIGQSIVAGRSLLLDPAGTGILSNGNPDAEGGTLALWNGNARGLQARLNGR